MTKATDYDELIEDLARTVITEYLEGGVDYMTVVESVDERGLDYDDDLYKDVHDYVNGSLDDLLQRYLDF